MPKSLIKESRYGEGSVQLHLMPYLPREPEKYAGDLYAMDGTPHRLSEIVKMYNNLSENGKESPVYDEKDPDTVHLFTHERDTYLCECRRFEKTRASQVGRDEAADKVILKHDAKNKSYRKYLKNERDRRISAGLRQIGKDEITDRSTINGEIQRERRRIRSNTPAFHAAGGHRRQRHGFAQRPATTQDLLCQQLQGN